ncbi:hypothetical protein RhiXN_01701 [Rhizoctonia solani]|uniref:Uncharacterized protein n=1 Tax=Rhizoctonia solani TaxID=456999 RepID=A0A8H8P7P5_9AGAM|nr:uncharacterized protein RhiXN_01701 [Rhizoctonia solani]QRW27106.1 hypothetical protein RhiXN_01701 [Rhizoctonia solani]
MPDHTSASGESDVELMAIVVDSQNHGHCNQSSRVYTCMAPESRDVWSTSTDEVVHGVRSVRPSLSEGAAFKYHQVVGVMPNVEWWQNYDGSRATKKGVILAGWCERENDDPQARKRYTYWVRCERDGARPTQRWYEQHELFTLPDKVFTGKLSLKKALA